jgi:transcriptional regulator with XRE-family HTH domain
VDNILKENFATYLCALHSASGLSRADLSAKIGISTEGLRLLESGKRSPSLEVLISIADVFGVSLDALVGRDADFSPPATDPLVDAIKSLTPSQRSDVEKYIEFIKSRS